MTLDDLVKSIIARLELILETNDPVERVILAREVWNYIHESKLIGLAALEMKEDGLVWRDLADAIGKSTDATRALYSPLAKAASEQKGTDAPL